MTLNPKSLLEVFLILNVDTQMIENVCERGFIRDRGMYESLRTKVLRARPCGQRHKILMTPNLRIL